jgi:hypothetical protein
VKLKLSNRQQDVEMASALKLRDKIRLELARLAAKKRLGPESR